MNCTIVTWAVIVLSSSFAMAGEFPYGVDELTVRHARDSFEIGSFATPEEVPAVNGGMPMSDSVATLAAEVMDFFVVEDENWAEGTNAVGQVQAALSMKRIDGVRTWMGYTGGSWAAFTPERGEAEEGDWEVKIDVDYSLSPARIRYSIRRPGTETYVNLLSGGNAWVVIGTTEIEQKVNQVLLYGYGDAESVRVQSGTRRASADSVAITNDLELEAGKLIISVNATDAWGVDSVKVAINGRDRMASFVDGVARIDVSDCIEMGEDYAYAVSLVGEYRGVDVTTVVATKEVFVGKEDAWFAYADGVFTNAVAGSNLTNENGVLSAAPVSPRGLVNPGARGPGELVSIVLDLTLNVTGAIKESTLGDLDVSNAKTSLTVVRFGNGARGWAIRTAEGWVRLSGEGVSTVNDPYSVRMIFKRKKGESTVACAIKDRWGDAFVAMKDEDGNAEFPVDDAVFDKVSLLGGTVSSISAVCKSKPRIVRGLVLVVR